MNLLASISLLDPDPTRIHNPIFSWYTETPIECIDRDRKQYLNGKVKTETEVNNKYYPKR